MRSTILDFFHRRQKGEYAEVSRVPYRWRTTSTDLLTSIKAHAFGIGHVMGNADARATDFGSAVAVFEAKFGSSADFSISLSRD